MRLGDHQPRFPAFSLIRSSGILYHAFSSCRSLCCAEWDRRKHPRFLRFLINHVIHIQLPCDMNPSSIVPLYHDEPRDSTAFSLTHFLSLGYCQLIDSHHKYDFNTISFDLSLSCLNFLPRRLGCILRGWTCKDLFIGVVTHRQSLRERCWSCVGMSQ